VERPFVAAMDMALKHDTAALRTVQVVGDELVTESRIWVPNGDVLDVAAIEQEIIRLHRTGNLTECAYDPAYFERSAQALLDEGYLTGLTSEQLYYEQSALLQAQFLEKKRVAQDAARTKEYGAQFAWQAQVNALMQGSFNQQLQGTGIMLGKMSELMLSSKKKEFEVGKKAAIGQALISTYLGVASALSYGFPMGLIFAAIQLAVGMANVNRIRSQKFGGGGGASATFNASPAGTPEPASVTNAEPVAPSLPQTAQATTQPRNINITIASDSGMVSTEWLRNTLIPGLNEAVGDGVTLRTMAA
jgi:hypothetical protein